MAELGKKIAGLEEEIEGYKAEYKTVSAAQEKRENSTNNQHKSRDTQQTTK